MQRISVAYVVVKQIKKELDAPALHQFRSEVALMCKIPPHLNVLSLKGVCSLRPPFCIVTGTWEKLQRLILQNLWKAGLYYNFL